MTVAGESVCTKTLTLYNYYLVSTILLGKLGQYGVRGKELEWFDGYLSGRRQRVCIGEAKSKWTEECRKDRF